MVSAAVIDDRSILGEASFHTRQGHMERLLPVIDNMLDSLGIAIRDLDAFSVAVGPGSFTSLRVGLATAKAFAHALGKPLAGVPTLDALALGLHGTPGLICALLPARAQEVYASFYITGGGGMKRLSGYLALDPVWLAGRLQKELRTVITFTGEGALLYRDLLRDTLGDRAVLAEPAQLWPRAALVAAAGLALIGKRGPGARQNEVHALYVKQPAIRRS